MSYKSNTFPSAKTKKTPIKFGGFGNLFKHTHTFSPPVGSLYFTRPRAGDNLRLFLHFGKEGRFALFVKRSVQIIIFARLHEIIIIHPANGIRDILHLQK